MFNCNRRKVGFEMKFCLLSSDPSATIQIIYYAYTQGLGIENVIMLGDGGDRFWILKEYANKVGLNLFFIENLENRNLEEALKGIKPDVLILNVAKIVSKKIIDIPNVATVNTHTGILPQYRGSYTAKWALLEGGPVGTTAHIVDTGLDTGPILTKKILDLKPGDTFESIMKRNHYQNKWQALVDALIQLKNGTAKPIKQRADEGRRYFPMHPKLFEIVKRLAEFRGKNISSKQTKLC